MNIALASVIRAGASASSPRNRIRKTSAVLRKLSLKAAKNWHQNSAAKRLDSSRGGAIICSGLETDRRLQVGEQGAQIEFPKFTRRPAQPSLHFVREVGRQIGRRRGKGERRCLDIFAQARRQRGQPDHDFICAAELILLPMLSIAEDF